MIAGSNLEFERKKKDKFKQERAKHYNEYERMQEFQRRKEVGLESDEDEDEEDELETVVQRQ